MSCKLDGMDFMIGMSYHDTPVDFTDSLSDSAPPLVWHYCKRRWGQRGHSGAPLTP